MFSAVRHFARPRRALPAFRIPAHRTIVTKKYTSDHEFVAFDDTTGVGTVGITNYAQETLGDVVFVDLPAVGKEISQGDPIGAVESVKAASDIFAPVSGKVVQINEELHEQPGLVNRSPGEEGWLCKIEVSKPTEVDELLTLEAYTKICEPQ